MKRPPILRPRMSTGHEDHTEVKSIEKIVKSTRNSSAENKERPFSIIWNLFGKKSRAHSINKENSYIEPKSSRESLRTPKEIPKKQVVNYDSYPRAQVHVGVIRNSFYNSFDQMSSELEKFEKIKKDFEIGIKG